MPTSQSDDTAVPFSLAREGTRRWENRVKARYYEARLLSNLFGELEVFRVWGGIGSALGGHRCEPVADIPAGHDVLASIEKRRAVRGYVCVRDE